MMFARVFSQLSLFIMVLLVSGCATERYFQGTGFQAASVEQQQVIDVVIKQRKAAEQQVQALITQFEQQQPLPTYQVNYRSALGKAVAQTALKNVAQHRVQYQRNSNMIADVQLVVNSPMLLVSECQPAQIGVRNGQPHCYVDAARFQHTANKARLMGVE